MDFMTAKSEADGIAESRRIAQKKLADLIVKSMVTTVNKNRGNMGVPIKQIRQLLSTVSQEDQVEVMIQAFIKMC